MSRQVVIEEPVVQPPIDDPRDRPQKGRRSQTKQRTKRLPPYCVILHNDPYNGMDFVVASLKKVFGYSSSKAIYLMMRAHLTGSSHVWSGSLEVAELKADQLKSRGADPTMRARGAQPLSVSIEPLD